MAGAQYLTESSRNPTATATTGTTSTVNSTAVRGLQLTVITNDTNLQAGHSLNVTISLQNTSPAPLNISTTNDWQIPGFPVSVTSACFGYEPIEFMIVRGNYTLNALEAASTNSSGSFPIYCMEGGWVNYVTFEPNSVTANFTGMMCEASCHPQTYSYRLMTNFTVSGYWGYPLNSSEVNDILSEPNPPCYVNGVRDCSTFAYPEVGPTAQHKFVDGAYTLAVEDEWGDVLLLSFTAKG